MLMGVSYGHYLSVSMQYSIVQLCLRQQRSQTYVRSNQRLLHRRKTRRSSLSVLRESQACGNPSLDMMLYGKQSKKKQKKQNNES